MEYCVTDFPGCDQMSGESSGRVKSVGGRGLVFVYLLSLWLTVGGCWPQAGEAAGHMAPAVRKQRESFCSAHILSFIPPGPQFVECPKLWQIFPTLLTQSSNCDRHAQRLVILVILDMST